MRILGVVLILFGLFLCLTIIAAPVGIFFVIVGVVCIVLGGRRKTVINNVVQVSSTPGSVMQANVVDNDNRSRGTRVIEPLRAHDPEHLSVRQPPLIDITPRAQTNGYAYDRAKWNALVQYDADIERVAKALTPYGEKYVDQFAAAYLALNDKDYLPKIIEKILESAKQDAAAGQAARG
jgi:hypothetical protein